MYCILHLLTTVYNYDDGLDNEKPGRSDLKLARIDANYLQNNRKPPKTDKDIAFENHQRMENQVNTLKNFLGVDGMHSLTSSKLWKEIYDYIMDHLNEFLKNNKIFFKMYIRYNFCLYVIPLLPTDEFLVFPSFYKYLLPSKLLKEPLVSDFIKSIDKFLAKIKEKSGSELLVDFTVSRQFSVAGDLKIIKDIPELIKHDPVKLLRWLLEFDVKIDPEQN